MSNVKYTDAVANAFSEAKAWRAASVLLGLVVGILSIALVMQSRATPLTLVPYDFATSKGNITVQPTKDFSESSPDYLAQLALGDLALVLNWTPENVELQHQRFLNRMTPELYAEQNVAMMTQAVEFKSNSTTQSFYPTTTKVGNKGSQVVVEGTLVRWTGEKESVRVHVTYTITYAKTRGFAHVASLKIQK
jgi:type IV conjugative transfer system protein TraE